MSAGGSKNGLSGDASGNHQRFSIQGRPKSPLVFEIPENSSNNPVIRKRKGASTVGLGLSDINQQFCSTMIGITFGGPSSSVTETTLQLSKPPMGNKHSEPPQAASGSHEGRLVVTSTKDDVDEPVIDVPNPMEPIRTPAMVAGGTTTNTTTSEPPLEASHNLESPQIKPNIHCDDDSNAQQHAGQGQLEAAVSSSDGGGETSGQPADVADSAGSSSSVPQPHLQERKYRLQELLETERTYIEKLEQCCHYIQFMEESKQKEDHELPMPKELKDGRDRIIFGNIAHIHEWHRDNFLKNLENCIESGLIVDLAKLFKEKERKINPMYVKYCQNKPKSEYIVSEYLDTYIEEIRLKLGYKLRLTDLLIEPVQRLTKYHLLLETLVKLSRKAGLEKDAEILQKAHQTMKVVADQCNDMMDIGRLEGFEGKITSQGQLLYKGPLNVLDTFSTTSKKENANGPPKMKPFNCFLFEQSVIFSETVGKKTTQTSYKYEYKAHFLINKMVLEDKFDGEPLKFIIRSNDPARRDDLRIVCEAESDEIKKIWTGLISRQLDIQWDFLKQLQNPTKAKPYSRGDNWETSTPAAVAEKSLTSPGSSPTGKSARARTQSHLHPLGGTVSGTSCPDKSPQQVEVSPFRRWSEAAVTQPPAASAASNQPPQWQTNFERCYIELEELGKGRFSVVRKCQEIISGNEVAVKFINRRKQGEQETLREYKYLSEMKHPNVISALGVFLTSDNSYAIVMTLIPGGKPFLEKFCAKSTYSELDVYTYLSQTLQALNYLHNKQRLIYLDLKPENVILDAQWNCVRLIDFGCAQSIQIRSNGIPTNYESTEFLAPELVSQGPVGTYTDMWAFGVLLYVALSGLSPFLDDSNDETNNNILRGDFSFPDEHFCRVSTQAKDLIGRILCVNPSQRVSANVCLDFAWFNSKSHSSKGSHLPTTHLSTFVRRRKKKLNSISLLTPTTTPTRTSISSTPEEISRFQTPSTTPHHQNSTIYYQS